MDIFKELQGAGLVKNTHVEQFDGKDEVTTSGNIATTVVPLGDEADDVEERFDDQEESQEDAVCEKIKAAVQALGEAFEMISGKDLSEMFCADCTTDDMRNAPDSDQNQSPSDNVTNAERGDYKSANERG